MTQMSIFLINKENISEKRFMTSKNVLFPLGVQTKYLYTLFLFQYICVFVYW